MATAASYCQEIDCMHENLKNKQSRRVNRDGPIFLHDNACPHTPQATVQNVKHSSYSYDISPTDNHLLKHFDFFVNNNDNNNDS